MTEAQQKATLTDGNSTRAKVKFEDLQKLEKYLKKERKK